MKCKLIFLVAAILFWSSGHAEEASVKRIYAHLLIKDYPSALQEAQAAIKKDSASKPLWEAYIKAIAKAGDEKRMLSAWKQYAALFPEEQKNREMLETMAWAIIEKGSLSNSPVVRIISLIGAHASNDAKGIDILARQMHDTNSYIRAIAVELSGSCGDAKLCNEVHRLLKQEGVWDVRLEVIKTLGSLRVKAAKPDLVAIIGDDKTSAEEKALAIQALVNILDTADRDEVEKLAKSDRAGLRDLACQVVSYFELERDLDLILPLLQDHRAEVRTAALEVLGTLRVKEFAGQPITLLVEQKLQDPEPETALMGARVLTLLDPVRGQEAFRAWFSHQSRDVRLLAAASLASCGKYSMPLLAEVFHEAKDPYVKMNLAIALIGLRVETDAACQTLYDTFRKNKERWMWDERGRLRILAPSTVTHDDMIPNYPEAVNQVTRLEILNILALMKHPQTQEAIKNFLLEKSWGVSGLASALLLTEGDENAVDLIQGLLSDPDPKIHLQAALILSMWGSGETAISVLQEAYPKVDRENKERILESIGRIGAESALPFLIERLGESHQTLRLIAAASLLMTLYH